jgi:hypothetical protein
MFTVHPNEIRDFGGNQLVTLLRRFIYVEIREAGLPLRASKRRFRSRCG